MQVFTLTDGLPAIPLGNSIYLKNMYLYRLLKGKSTGVEINRHVMFEPTFTSRVHLGLLGCFNLSTI